MKIQLFVKQQLFCLLLSLLLFSGLLSVGTTTLFSADVIDIGSRRELFADGFLIGKLAGDVKQVVHQPEPKEVVLVTGKPWEGNTSAYYTIFQDGDLYRMYYRGSHASGPGGKGTHPEVTCYAESKDGVHWTKPELGLFEFKGSKKNNIVWDGIGTHCFTAFKDLNPKCPAEARYKAISRGRPQGKKGLYVFQSPDGIHWKLIKDEPVITTGAFDSQNLAFWDPHLGSYREFHRTFVDGVRAIMTGTSKDYVTWSKPELLKYTGAPKEHLYTNAIRTYARAPHLLVGFPTRYLPNEGSRVEPIFMISRDGKTFHRWNEPVIPESAPQDRGGNRSNYMTWGLLSLPGKPNELSVYGTEAYYSGPDSRVRRFAYRVDGFVSVQASDAGGTLLTKPFTFTGKRLRLNYVTHDGGSVKVTVADEQGKPIKGFAENAAKPISGDFVDQVVSWKTGTDVSGLAGKVVRLRFHLKNADLYSLRFEP